MRCRPSWRAPRQCSPAARLLFHAITPPLYDITPPSLLYKVARPSAAAACRSHRHARPSGGHYLQENLRRMKIYFQSLKKKFPKPEKNFQGMKNYFQGMKKFFQAWKKFWQAWAKFWQAWAKLWQAWAKWLHGIYFAPPLSPSRRAGMPCHEAGMPSGQPPFFSRRHAFEREKSGMD